MDEVTSDLSQTLTSLGIDESTLDDGSLDLSEYETAEQDAEAVTEEATSKEVVTNDDGDIVQEDAQAVKTEGEEKTEAPVEEPKLTAKEFQEIYAAKQELELKEKAFIEQMQTREQEFQTQYQEKITEYDKFDSFLSSLAQKDPDLFSVLQNEYQEHYKHYANPMVDKVSKELAELRKEVGAFKAKASDTVSLTKLNTDLEKTMSTYGKEAETLGIKVDSKAIEDLWAKGLTTDQAFNALHGDQLRKAALSKAKVEIAEKKVQAQPKVATVGSVNRSNVPKGVSMKDMSWDQALAHSVKSVLGKA